jgi:SulP family sulfate permease
VHALTLGVLAFAPLGAESAEIGIRAGFAAAVYGGIAATLLSGTPLPATGARASTSLILAGFVVTLAADPELGAAGTVALATLSVAAAGVLQIAFGALRLGNLAKFVPYPVIGGFMTGWRSSSRSHNCRTCSASRPRRCASPFWSGSPRPSRSRPP